MYWHVPNYDYLCKDRELCTRFSFKVSHWELNSMLLGIVLMLFSISFVLNPFHLTKHCSDKLIVFFKNKCSFFFGSLVRSVLGDLLDLWTETYFKCLGRFGWIRRDSVEFEEILLNSNRYYYCNISIDFVFKIFVSLWCFW